jgi:hypothetical protein
MNDDDNDDDDDESVPLSIGKNHIKSQVRQSHCLGRDLGNAPCLSRDLGKSSI